MKITRKTIFDNKNQKYPEVYVDNVKVGNFYTSEYSIAECGIYVDKDCLDYLLIRKLSDMDRDIEGVHLPFQFELGSILDSIGSPEYFRIEMQCYFKSKQPFANIAITPVLNEWSFPFSFLQLLEKTETLCSQDDHIEFYYPRNRAKDNRFGITLPEINYNAEIRVTYDFLRNRLNNIITTSIELLNSSLADDPLRILFRFPTEVQAACEQYLTYFKQFLLDLGIIVSTQIELNGLNTIFTISPSNSSIALTQLRDALNVYLCLVDSPNIESVSRNFNDLSVKQLISNVNHLKAQIMLVNATIQAKDATISSLYFINSEQAQLLASYREKEKNVETVLNGLVTVDKFKGKGFTLNLPELYRRLIRKTNK